MLLYLLILVLILLSYTSCIVNAGVDGSASIHVARNRKSLPFSAFDSVYDGSTLISTFSQPFYDINDKDKHIFGHGDSVIGSIVEFHVTHDDSFIVTGVIQKIHKVSEHSFIWRGVVLDGEWRYLLILVGHFLTHLYIYSLQ